MDDLLCLALDDKCLSEFFYNQMIYMYDKALISMPQRSLTC